MTVVATLLVAAAAGTVAIGAASGKRLSPPYLAAVTLGDQTLYAFETELSDEDSPASPQFSLRAKIPLSSAPDFVRAQTFHRGDEFGLATLAVLDQTLSPMTTYTLTGDVRITAVRYTSNQATIPPQFFQEIVLTGTSFSTSP